MKEVRSKPFEHILHPFIFILKEGTEIQEDFLDYSLLLLQVSQAETLRSPQNGNSSTPIIQLLKR